MRWRALLSSCHPFTAGHKHKPHCMYGLQVHAQFSRDSGMKVVICTVAKWRLENDDLPDGSLNRWEIEWSHAKTSLWEEVCCSSGLLWPYCSVVSDWESWRHEWVGGEGTESKRVLQTNNVHLKQNRCCKSVMMELCLQGFSQLLVQTVFSLQKTVDW